MEGFDILVSWIVLVMLGLLTFGFLVFLSLVGGEKNCLNIKPRVVVTPDIWR